MGKTNRYLQHTIPVKIVLALGDDRILKEQTKYGTSKGQIIVIAIITTIDITRLEQL